jgi:hypothetical protein
MLCPEEEKEGKVEAAGESLVRVLCPEEEEEVEPGGEECAGVPPRW